MTAELRTTPPAKIGYLPTLDGWRAIAIALVFFHHGHESLAAVLGVGVERLAAAIPDIGFLGVRIFFALSGFLICSRLIDEERIRGRIALKAFYVRRAFRILPAMLTMMFTVLALMLAGVLVVPLTQWLAGVTFLINYVRGPHDTWYVGHLWSLSVEEHFYMLFPAMLVIVGVARGAYWSIAGAIVVAAWRAILFKATAHHPTFDGAYFWGRSDVIADGLLWGCAAAFLHASPIVRVRWKQFAVPAIWWPLAILVVGLTVTRGHARDWKVAMLAFEFQTLAIPLLIVSTVVRPTSAASRVLEWTPLRWVGRLSYSLYLWQQLFLVKGVDVVPSFAALQRFPTNLVTIATLSVASYFLLELPLMKIGHRLAKPATAGREELKETPAAEITVPTSAIPAK